MQVFKTPPLVVTLKIDDESQQYFSALRKKYFPAHANYLDAHLTLFHNLPANEKDIREELMKARSHPVFEMQANEIRNIGNGVAFGLVSSPLETLHRQLQQALDKYLITQDRQRLWPHITIQNKVTAHKAQNLSDELRRDFKPLVVKAIGLCSWLYMKGPWMAQEEFLFEIK